MQQIDDYNLMALKGFDYSNSLGFLEGIGTLWRFELGLSQNYRDVTATISQSVSIFLMNAS